MTTEETKKKISRDAVLELEIGDSNKKFPLVDEGSVREVKRGKEEIPGFKTPCSISGLTAGLSSGMLGYVFGFGGYWMKERTKGVWKIGLQEGWKSAKTFALLGGLYAGVSCFMLRIREKSDAWNAAVSGCSTGLVLGWKSGGISALQSCVLFGMFSFFVDNMSDGDVANAKENDISKKKWCCVVSKKRHHQYETMVPQKRRHACMEAHRETCLVPGIPIENFWC